MRTSSILVVGGALCLVLGGGVTTAAIASPDYRDEHRHPSGVVCRGEWYPREFHDDGLLIVGCAKAEPKHKPRPVAQSTTRRTTVAPPTSTTTRPTVEPSVTRTTATSTTSVYYPNCDAVRAAGKAPLYRNDPGYRPALDRDDDGVACE